MPSIEWEERLVDREHEVALARAGTRRIRPLCIQSQRPWRNGWVFVSWIAVPVDARMCARKSGEVTAAASSRRLRSFQAGCVLR